MGYITNLQERVRELESVNRLQAVEIFELKEKNLMLEKKVDSGEKSEDVLEKERQRKVSEENAKAEKLQLENLMRLVQEKIERARKEKERRLAENLKE